jgi:FKBP-type peptidyl-prolyl cis-trans isomerase FkpA
MKGFSIIAGLILVSAAISACKPHNAAVVQPAAEATSVSDSAAPTTAAAPIDHLVVEDTVEGTGAAVQAGQTAIVHYTGWLYDPVAKDHKGQKFDSSRDQGQPFRFPLGAGRVIRGWDEGVVGMKIGGQRTLIVPPDFGYGSTGAGGVIPPNATLLFEVELLGAENAQ